MSNAYRIYGAEPSPYSVKVRSYFRFKGIAHEWLARTAARQEEFQALAKLPLIPLVVTPEGEALQDSTPIIETLERRHPEPPLEPADPVLAFLSALIEEYADEWGNKPMFHYRWTYEADRAFASAWIAQGILPDAPPETRAKVEETIRERMVPRLSFVGSDESTAPVIEGSYRRLIAILNDHLAARPYVFGGRPCLGDLGLGGQLYELSKDPTPAALMRETAPHVVAYVERMLAPKIEGGFEGWSALAPGLTPLLEAEVAGLFLPWSDANEKALAKGEERFTVSLEGRPFSQDVQKYHAKSLGVLRQRYEAAKGDAALARLMQDTGCADYL